MLKWALFLLIAAGIVLWAEYEAAFAEFSFLAAGVVFFVALAIAFTRGTEALYLIVFAVLFSPEIGATGPAGRSGGEGAGGVVIRLEDVLLFAVACGWLLRTAYQRRHFGILNTPVNRPLLIYMGVSLLATLFGILAGRVQIFSGLMNNLKYFEYAFLFFMVLAHVRTREAIVRMVDATFLAFFLALVYGYSQINPSNLVRVCAPFDTEPNTFGGYIVLIQCVAFGVLLTDRRFAVQARMGFLCLFAIGPLLFTLSRASYLAFFMGVFTFLAVSRYRIAVLAVTFGMLAVFLMLYPMLPARVQDRIEGTFRKGSQYHVQVAGIDLDPSASARIISYGEAIDIWERSPLLGHGVTGTHFIDSQYFRQLAETGLIGLGAFLFLIATLLREVWRVYLGCDDAYLKGVSLGLFVGIVAMLMHAVSANTFIIVRISEPFWLLSALVLLIPRTARATEAVEPVRIPGLLRANISASA
jgi:hypothetical protein